MHCCWPVLVLEALKIPNLKTSIILNVRDNCIVARYHGMVKQNYVDVSPEKKIIVVPFQEYQENSQVSSSPIAPFISTKHYIELILVSIQ